MAEELLTGASPASTRQLIEGFGEFTPAERTLDGLTPEQAVAKLEGWPYSVAELVAHMVFWQGRLNRAFRGQKLQAVASAAEGWPAVGASDWPRLRDEYLAGLEVARGLAADPDVLAHVQGGNYTVGFRMLSHLGHDAYHLGQIALLRRVMGAWPPPGGGDTW